MAPHRKPRGRGREMGGRTLPGFGFMREEWDSRKCRQISNIRGRTRKQVPRRSRRRAGTPECHHTLRHGRKQGLTQQQPTAVGVPSLPSTLGGAVYNGHKPGDGARAGREHELALPPCTHRYGADSHRARRDRHDLTLERRGSQTVSQSVSQWRGIGSAMIALHIPWLSAVSPQQQQQQQHTGTFPRQDL